MSEYSELLPGQWLVKCVDVLKTGCKGDMWWLPEAGVICEAHARARNVLPALDVATEPSPAQVESSRIAAGEHTESSSEVSPAKEPEKAPVESEVPVEGEAAVPRA